MTKLENFLLYFLPASLSITWLFIGKFILQFFSGGDQPLHLFHRFFELACETPFIRVFTLPHLSLVLTLIVILAREALPRGYSIWKLTFVGYFLGLCGVLPFLLGLCLSQNGRKFSEQLFPIKSIGIYVLGNSMFLCSFPGHSLTNTLIGQLAFTIWFFGGVLLIIITVKSSDGRAFKEVEGTLTHSNIAYVLAAGVSLAIYIFAWNDFLRNSSLDAIMFAPFQNPISTTIIIDQSVCTLSCALFMLADGKNGLPLTHRLVYAALSVPFCAVVLPLYMAARNARVSKSD